MVKETDEICSQLEKVKVSIPSRGSGKGDKSKSPAERINQVRFQSPLGEVVKETT